MELELEGQRALVTGSSAGIGEAIAHALADEAAVVAIHGRSAEHVARVVKAIRARGGSAVDVIADLSSTVAVATRQQRRHFGSHQRLPWMRLVAFGGLMRRHGPCRTTDGG